MFIHPSSSFVRHVHVPGCPVRCAACSKRLPPSVHSFPMTLVDWIDLHYIVHYAMLTLGHDIVTLFTLFGIYIVPYLPSSTRRAGLLLWRLDLRRITAGSVTVVGCPVPSICIGDYSRPLLLWSRRLLNALGVLACESFVAHHA